MKLTKLKRVAALRAGGTPSVQAERFWRAPPDGVPWVAIGDMSDGGLVSHTARHVSPEGIADKRLPVGSPGTVLFAMYASLGAVAELAVEASWNQALLGIEPLHGASERRFVRYWLEHLRPSLGALARSNTQDNLNAEQVANLYFPVLSVGAQRAIADYLDIETGRIDALITKKRRMIELLEERWIAEVTDATTSSGRNGSRIALRRVIDSTIGGAWGKDPGQGDLDALCVRGTDFDTAFLRVDNDRAPIRSFTHEEFQRRRLVGGDLVIEKSGGGDKQPVGRAVQWYGDDAGIPTNFAARIRPAAGVNSRFLAFLLRASYETGVTRRWIKQTTGIQNLDLGGFCPRSTLFLFPVTSLRSPSDSMKRRGIEV